MQPYLSKKELIYNAIKSRIIAGEYEFGERLVLSHLAKDFQSSEIPVREALNQLTTEGLVEFKTHVGAVVSTLSLKDLQEIFEIRVKMEALAIELAVARYELNEIEQLRLIHQQSIRAFNNQDYEQFEELNVEFHMHIYRLCGNDLLLQMIKDLWSNTNRYPSLFNRNDAHIKLSIKEHGNILTAIESKDAKLAEKEMTKHKIRATNEIMNFLK